jgi:hypothetical protein
MESASTFTHSSNGREKMMTSSKVKLMFLIKALSLVAALAVPQAGQAQELPKNLPSKIVAAIGEITVDSFEVQREDTLDGSTVYRLDVRISNESSQDAWVSVEYEIRARQGHVRAGGSITFHEELVGFGERKWTRFTTFGGAALEPGDTILVRAQSHRAGKDQFGKMIIFPPISCEIFCDICGNRAQALCTAGVGSFSCSCGANGGATCNFNCFPPPA